MKEKARRIFIIGDSTCQNNNCKTYPQTGWGQVLPLFLKPEVKVFNHAKNGKSTKSFKNSGLFVPVLRRLRENDLLLIQFGHNDMKEDDSSRYTTYPEYRQYLKYYMDCAKRKNAIPILLTSCTRRHFKTGKIDENNLRDYPSEMLESARINHVICLDIFRKSVALYNEIGDQDSKKYVMNFGPLEYDQFPEGLSDDTHFRHEGAFAMAKLIVDALKEQNLFSDILL